MKYWYTVQRGWTLNTLRWGKEARVERPRIIRFHLWETARQTYSQEDLSLLRAGGAGKGLGVKVGGYRDCFWGDESYKLDGGLCWVHISLNKLETPRLYRLNGWDVWGVNYSWRSCRLKEATRNTSSVLARQKFRKCDHTVRWQVFTAPREMQMPQPPWRGLGDKFSKISVFIYLGPSSAAARTLSQR